MTHVLGQITQFLAQSITLVIGWFVVLAATAFLNPYMTHRLQRAAARHDDHLRELKHDLLRPMLAHLDQHVFPVLEHRVGNVGIQNRLVPVQTAGLTEIAVTADSTLVYHEASEPPIDAYLNRDGEDAVVPAFLDGPLARDARQRHFQTPLRDWDALMARFQDYNAACIRYVDELRSAITQAAILPVFQLIDMSDDRWINSTQLAVVLCYRQLGLANFPFSHRTDRSPQVLEYGSQHLAHGKQEEISQCLSLLGTLMARRDTIERLMGLAQAIREDALRVRASLEDHLLRRRLRWPWLRHRCPYI